MRQSRPSSTDVKKSCRGYSSVTGAIRVGSIIFSPSMRRLTKALYPSTTHGSRRQGRQVVFDQAASGADDVGSGATPTRSSSCWTRNSVLLFFHERRVMLKMQGGSDRDVLLLDCISPPGQVLWWGSSAVEHWIYQEYRARPRLPSPTVLRCQTLSIIVRRKDVSHIGWSHRPASQAAYRRRGFL